MVWFGLTEGIRTQLVFTLGLGTRLRCFLEATLDFYKNLSVELIETTDQGPKINHSTPTTTTTTLDF